MKKRLRKFGARRLVRRFLWWPTTLPRFHGETRELQWLRVASIYQEYKQKFLRPTLTGGHWVDKEWGWDGSL